MNGFFNLIKPAGLSSFDMVNEVKKVISNETGIKCTEKIGHLGTLDPLAAGVLPIAVGKATKLFNYFINKKKTYIVNITFGILTDTIDASGKIIKTSGIIPNTEQVESVLKSFVGVITQKPPMFSAVSVNGKRAYSLARQGIETDLPKRKVTIYDIKFNGAISADSYSFTVTCSGGTYIRSLVLDIAKKLSTVAFMSMLIRSSSGEFDLENAITIEELGAIGTQKALIGYDKVLKDLKEVYVDEITEKKIDFGQDVFLNDNMNGQFLVKGNFGIIGIGETESNGLLKIKVRLK